MTRLKNTRAFTLIELIVVIVILGILAAIAVVGYNAIINTGKDKAATADVAQAAKTVAVAAASADGKPVVAASGATTATVSGAVVTLPAGVSAVAGADHICFYKEGASGSFASQSMVKATASLNGGTVTGAAPTAASCA